MVLLRAIGPVLAVLISAADASAAIVQAVWTGTVRSAVDTNQTLSDDPETLIGQTVTYSTIYDTAVGRVSSPSGQSISGGIYVGPDIFLSQRFRLGALDLPVPWRGYYDSLSLSFLSGATEFQSSSSISEGRYPPEAFFRLVTAQLLLGNAGAPASLETPFYWAQASGGVATGRYMDSIFSMETQSYRKFVDLGLDWTSVEVSVVPGPASGLLLITALIGGSFALRRRSSPTEIA